MSSVNYFFEAKHFLEQVGGVENIKNLRRTRTQVIFEVHEKGVANVYNLHASKLSKGIHWTRDQLEITLLNEDVEPLFSELTKMIDPNLVVNEVVVEPIVKLNPPLPEGATEIESASALEVSSANAKKPPENDQLQPAVNAQTMPPLPAAPLPEFNRTLITNSPQRALLDSPTFADIFRKALPIILILALLANIFNFLNQLGINFNSYVLYRVSVVLTTCATDSLGILACMLTMKKMKSQPTIAAVLGLALINPFFTDKRSMAIWNVWVQSAQNQTDQIWHSLGWWQPEVPMVTYLGSIPLISFQGLVVPFLLVGVMAAVIERVVSQRLSFRLDYLFAPFISIVITYLVGVFLIGPVMYYCDLHFAQLVNLAFTIPYNLGYVVVGTFLPLALVLNCHYFLLIPEMEAVLKSHDLQGQVVANLNAFHPLWSAVYMAQAGAVLASGLSYVTKRNRSWSFFLALTLFFGLPEPAIYGNNFWKRRHFLFTMVGSGLGGLFIGLLGIKSAKLGLIGIPGLWFYTDSVKTMLNINALYLVAALPTFLLCQVFYWPTIDLRFLFQKALSVSSFQKRVSFSEWRQMHKKTNTFFRCHLHDLKMMGCTFEKIRELELNKRELTQKLSTLTDKALHLRKWSKRWLESEIAANQETLITLEKCKTDHQEKLKQWGEELGAMITEEGVLTACRMEWLRLPT